jgi:hypothetical protein
VNSSDSHSDLFAVVDSIQTLLSNVSQLAHSWRFLSGVVFALVKYHQLADYSTRHELSEEEYVQETSKTLTQIKEKEAPVGNWLRGFYYNAALMRLDAAYERFFKACLSPGSEKDKGPDLYRKIIKRFPSSFSGKLYQESLFCEVRHEVNSLKHFPGGADPMEREKPDRLHRALTELVTFLKMPDVTDELRKKFSGGSIVAGRGRKGK